MRGLKNLFLIKNLDDLFIKLDNRLPYHEFIEVAVKAHAKADKREFSFNHFLYYKFLFNDLVNKYLEKKYINKLQYYCIKILSKIDLIRLYFLFLVRDRKYYCIDRAFNTNYKYLTLTLGSRRLIPEGFTDIKNITSPYKIIKFNMHEKVSIIRSSIKKRILPHLEAQYIITKRDIEYLDLSSAVIVIEECMNFEKQIFSDIIQNTCKKLIITQRGIPYIPLYFYNAEVQVNNSLTYDLLSRNNNILYQYNYPIQVNNLSSKKINNDINIGYSSDLGDFILNYKDKKTIDLFMSKITIANNYRLTISIHPIELVNQKNFLWYKNLLTNNIKIREEKSIELFFDNMDIIVGWVSTSLYQAFLYKKPVIILDLFNDNHCINYLNDGNTESMVRIVKNCKEFTDAINFFKTLSVDDMNKRYLKAYQQLNIKIY
jgi:hypothetical protein